HLVPFSLLWEDTKSVVRPENHCLWQRITFAHSVLWFASFCAVCGCQCHMLGGWNLADVVQQLIDCWQCHAQCTCSCRRARRHPHSAKGRCGRTNYVVSSTVASERLACYSTWCYVDDCATELATIRLSANCAVQLC